LERRSKRIAPFQYLAETFTAQKLPVPKFYGANADGTAYLQSDLGGTSLFDALRGGREKGGDYDAEEVALLKKTIRQLPHFQFARDIDYKRLLAPAVFDKQMVMFDLNYFKYCFLRTTQTDFDEVELQADFERFADDLTADEEQHFLYRDFQGRNVMLCEGQPYFIDFQGGKLGPLAYDVASFLGQASAQYPEALRAELLDCYLDEMLRIVPDFDADAFRIGLKKFLLFRYLQVLGAYGLRGRFERKRHFLLSIPPALKNLENALNKGFAAPYPHLEATLRSLIAQPEFQPAPRSPKGPLVVRIFSFSYKKGIPTDESGNGGGYVFDCRSTHNPARYDEYKQLTGLDKPVQEFLERDGEILTFLESVYKLADFHVARYIERGFTSLMFSFGCTGGQHRSVYSAQHLAEHLNRKFGIEVHLQHREQGISQILPASKP